MKQCPLNQALTNEPQHAITGGEELPDDETQQLPPKATIADSKDEKDALTTPPDPEQPSGVLSEYTVLSPKPYIELNDLVLMSGVIVHFISNLERQDLKGASGDREGVAGQDTDNPAEQSTNLPSSCVVAARPQYIRFDSPANFLIRSDTAKYYSMTI